MTPLEYGREVHRVTEQLSAIRAAKARLEELEAFLTSELQTLQRAGPEAARPSYVSQTEVQNQLGQVRALMKRLGRD